MAKDYKIPMSTKKGSPQIGLPNSLVKGSLSSKTGNMKGGTMLRPGEVKKISVPPCMPSPPAKKG